MGKHDSYGKKLLSELAGENFFSKGKTVEVDYGSGKPARIDGSIGDIGIEIESRVSKQVRGALVDLVFHKSGKKLLIIIPVHMKDPVTCASQCKEIFKTFQKSHNFAFEVVVLKRNRNGGQNKEITMSALQRLGFSDSKIK